MKLASIVLILLLLCTVSCAHIKERPAQFILGAAGIVVGVAVADENLVGAALGWCVGDSLGQVVDNLNEKEKKE